jgi:protein-tyrosine-phosphatase
MARSWSGRPAFRVLLVCTGNICRSAMAERLARAYLDEQLGEDAAAVEVLSAGTQAVVGSEMHPFSALVLCGFGAQAGDFRAQQLADAHARDADLTLTMTRAHRRDVLAAAPRAMTRIFTLREAAELLDLVGEDVEIAGADLPERARSLVGLMAQARAQRQAGGQDDVPDPMGQPLEAHQEAGDAIVAALLPVLGRIARLRDLPDLGPAAPEPLGTAA